MASRAEKLAAYKASKAASALKTQPPSEDTSIRSEITFHHQGGNKDKDYTFLAILDKFTCDNSIRKLDYTRDYYPQPGTTIFVEAEQIMMTCLTITLDEATGMLVEASINVSSRVHTMRQLRQVIESIEKQYIGNCNNDLRKTRYFFDQQPFPIYYGTDDDYGRKTIDYANMPKEFTYRKFPMTTYRNLGNIYGDKIKLVKRRVQHFSNVEWFKRTGAARTLGFLLAGPPGCGKTMLIQAIANSCDRHVINVRLTQGISASQLRNLFMQESIKIEDTNTGRTSNITVPFEQRLYVFEEVDVSCDFLRRPVDAPPMPLPLAGGVPTRSKGRTAAAGDDDDDDDNEKPSSKVKTRTVGRRTMNFRNPAEHIKASSNDGDDNGRGGGIIATYSSPHTVPTNPEKPNLADFLTLLDGVYETTGRIAIMTTNHPEMLDKALIRSGRFEFIHLEKFTYQETKEMFMGMYSMESELDPYTGKLHPAFHILSFIHDGTWSPAEIGSVINTHYDNPVAAAEQLYEQAVERGMADPITYDSDEDSGV